jgi:hypothetical protein
MPAFAGRAPTRFSQLFTIARAIIARKFCQAVTSRRSSVPIDLELFLKIGWVLGL